MNREEAGRVSVNRCVRDEEIGAIEEELAGASAGEWKLREGRLERFDGTPVNVNGLKFAAAARGHVPRLIAGIRALEEALRSAWADAACWKNQCAREREAHEATARRGKARARADGGLLAIAELLKLSDQPNAAERAADLLDRHAGGEDVAAFLKGELEWLRKADRERRESRAEERKREVAAVMAARQVLAERKGGKR